MFNYDATGNIARYFSTVGYRIICRCCDTYTCTRDVFTYISSCIHQTTEFEVNELNSNWTSVDWNTNLVPSMFDCDFIPGEDCISHVLYASQLYCIVSLMIMKFIMKYVTKLI